MMSDKFDEYLKKCTERIKDEGVVGIENDLAAGRIVLPHKVNAAKLAIDRHKSSEHSQHLFPPPPRSGFRGALKHFWLQQWKWIITTLVAIVLGILAIIYK